MKVAIPLFGSRVSPRFGFCQEILIVKIDDGGEIERKNISTEGLGIPQRIEQLKTLGVDTIICGGVNGFYLKQLSAVGFHVIPGVMGEAKEVLDLFQRGHLRPGWYPEGRGRRIRGKRGSPNHLRDA